MWAFFIISACRQRLGSMKGYQYLISGYTKVDPGIFSLTEHQLQNRESYWFNWVIFLLIKSIKKLFTGQKFKLASIVLGSTNVCWLLKLCTQIAIKILFPTSTLGTRLETKLSFGKKVFPSWSLGTRDPIFLLWCGFGKMKQVKTQSLHVVLFMKKLPGRKSI